jgi:aryl-alcohol dehydrogenase-like predicted oxidoreductase
MQTRQLGSYEVREVGLGTWNIGADWGEVSDEEGREAVRAALDAGITFLDTADVYGDGRSERHIAHVLDACDASDDVVVATKAGRRLDPHVSEKYDYDHLSSFVDRSRENLETESLDLVQLHCPPTDAYYQPETFDVGETFSGVPFETGLDAVEELERAVPDDLTLAQFTLRWILDHDAVSAVIPGSTSPEHIRENVAASEADSLTQEQHGVVADVYDEYIREHVHHRW